MNGVSGTGAYGSLGVSQNAARSASSSSSSSTELTEEEEATVRELKQRDSEVRAHEQAHKTVGGPYAGAIQFDTVTGPDGRQYATGGEVPIDSSPIQGNPEATIRKMDVVIRAALAPPDPSPQDFQVARSAQQAKLQAQIEVQKSREEERGESQSPLARLSEAIRAYAHADEASFSDTSDNFFRIV